MGLIIKWEISKLVKEDVDIGGLVLELIQRCKVSKNENIVVEDIVRVYAYQAEPPDYICNWSGSIIHYFLDEVEDGVWVSVIVGGRIGCDVAEFRNRKGRIVSFEAAESAFHTFSKCKTVCEILALFKDLNQLHLYIALIFESGCAYQNFLPMQSDVHLILLQVLWELALQGVPLLKTNRWPVLLTLACVAFLDFANFTTPISFLAVPIITLIKYYDPIPTNIHANLNDCLWKQCVVAESHTRPSTSGALWGLASSKIVRQAQFAICVNKANLTARKARSSRSRHVLLACVIREKLIFSVTLSTCGLIEANKTHWSAKKANTLCG